MQVQECVQLHSHGPQPSVGHMVTCTSLYKCEPLIVFDVDDYEMYYDYHLEADGDLLLFA